MLTPRKIYELIRGIREIHTQPRFGLYPPHKKIMDYITQRIKKLNESKINDLEKVKEMTNLLEGFVRYLDTINHLLRMDVEKVLTYIYYPDDEDETLANKDNLLRGNKGQIVRLWKDAYNLNNRGPIINRLIDCKNVIYPQPSGYEYTKTEGTGMPEQMQKKYREMLFGTRGSRRDSYSM